MLHAKHRRALYITLQHVRPVLRRLPCNEHEYRGCMGCTKKTGCIINPSNKTTDSYLEALHIALQLVHLHQLRVPRLHDSSYPHGLHHSVNDGLVWLEYLPVIGVIVGGKWRSKLDGLCDTICNTLRSISPLREVAMTRIRSKRWVAALFRHAAKRDDVWLHDDHFTTEMMQTQVICRNSLERCAHQPSQADDPLYPRKCSRARGSRYGKTQQYKQQSKQSKQVVLILSAGTRAPESCPTRYYSILGRPQRTACSWHSGTHNFTTNGQSRYNFPTQNCRTDWAARTMLRWYTLQPSNIRVTGCPVGKHGDGFAV